MKKNSLIIIMLISILSVFSVKCNNGSNKNVGENSLVLYLPFTGNIADSSGNGFSVENKGANLAQDRYGNKNQAIHCDRGSFLTIKNFENFANLESDGYTVSLWVKLDISISNDGDILGYGNYADGGYGFGYKAGKFYSTKVYTTEGSSYTLIKIGEYKRLLAENWNMLTISYSNGLMKSFVNGCLVEEKEVNASLSSRYDLVIGKSVTCWIDDVRVYNRCLSDVEIAEISGLSGSLRAAELNANLLSDFERGDLHPAKYEYAWHVWGHVGDDLSYCTTIENPVKSGSNTSNYCMASITFPTKCSGNLASKKTPSRKEEYTIYTEDGDMGDHHHIYQWKVMMYDSTIIEIDSLMWLTNNQICGNFQLYDKRCYTFAGKEGGIYYNGGIFNDNGKESNGSYVLNPKDRLKWGWRYRVLPDTAKVLFNYDIGKWTTWTYDIFWTKSDTGYWRLYKDGELISSKDNAVTLPECAPENNSLHLAHKFGQYTRWNDDIDKEIDSLIVYYDDIEFYLDPEDDGISISDICPECEGN